MLLTDTICMWSLATGWLPLRKAVIDYEELGVCELENKRKVCVALDQMFI